MRSAGPVGPHDPVYLQAFREYQQRRNFSTQTIRCRQAVLAAFSAHIQPRTILAATPEDVEQWLRTRRLGPQGRYTYLSHLHCFYRFVCRRGLTTSDPTAAIDRPKLPRALPRPITPAELDEALTKAGVQMRAWLLLGSYQGLRRAEIARLRCEDVDADRGTLRVVSGKGNKDAVLPLHPGVLEALRACGLSRSGPLFRTPAGDQPSPAYVGDNVARFLRSVGINRTLHSTRHHYGTELYRLCRDLLLTSALMRHSHVSATQRYVACDEGGGAEVVRRLGSRPSRDSE